LLSQKIWSKTNKYRIKKKNPKNNTHQRNSFHLKVQNRARRLVHSTPDLDAPFPGLFLDVLPKTQPLQTIQKQQNGTDKKKAKQGEKGTERRSRKGRWLTQAWCLEDSRLWSS